MLAGVGGGLATEANSVWAPYVSPSVSEAGRPHPVRTPSPSSAVGLSGLGRGPRSAPDLQGFRGDGSLRA